MISVTCCQLMLDSKLCIVSTCFADRDLADEKPGGSGMLEAFLGLESGPLLSSTTQLGGGGAFIVIECVIL